jgi:O-antigen/teichoic acid export membrane protein
MMEEKKQAIVLPPDVAAPKKKHIGAKAFIGTFGTSVFIQCCGILQGIIVARLLGPVGRGEFAAVMLWPMMFAGLGILGSNIAIARVSAKLDDHDSILRTAIVLALITSGLSALVCFIALPWLMPQAESHLVALGRLFVLVIPLNHLALNLIAVDQGIGNFKNFNFTRAILNPLYVAILVGLWVFGIREVRWFAVALLVSALAVVLVRLFLAARRQSLTGKLYSLVSLLKQSIHFGLAGIAQPLYLQTDKVLMLWLLGTKNLGLYVVALSASAVIGSITESAGIVSFTMAAQADKGDGFEHLTKTFRISLLLWLFFGALLALIMPLVLPFVYGSDFADAVNPARLLIIGSAFASLASMLEQVMRGQGRAFVGLESRLAGLATIVILGIILAKAFGLPGVCLAYIAGQCACLSVIISRTSKHYSAKTAASYIPRFCDVNYISNLFLRFICKLLRTGLR